MSIDKRVDEAERKVMEEINQICEGKMKWTAMKDPSTPNNYYNWDEEGSIILLGFDFQVLNIDEEKLVLVLF